MRERKKDKKKKNAITKFLLLISGEKGEKKESYSIYFICFLHILKTSMTKQIILFKYKTIFKSQSQIKFIILSKKQILKANGRPHHFPF